MIIKRSFWWILVLVLALVSASVLSWGWRLDIHLSDAYVLVLTSVLTYVISVFLAQRTSRIYKGFGATLNALVTGILVYALLATVLLISRVYYSSTFLLVMFVGTVLSIYGVRFLQGLNSRPVYGYVPGQVPAALLKSGSVEWIALHESSLSNKNFSALVANPNPIEPEMQRLIANCHINNIPVLSPALLLELKHGRILLDGKLQDCVSDFHPPPVYAPIKQAVEILIVILASPIVLPFMLLIAVFIKLESPGPVLFVQQRIGQAGKPFRMFKFRSMYTGAENNGARFADEKDDRVTQVGRLIRRLRIDELPQLWNVLRGEMSLIGPRPEQVDFVRTFEKSIPFYSFRHLVKPGITGWAQVNQGYVDCEETTREKLEYDLYYAKHFSPWLDLVIVFRTLRIIATGFGAR
jgi:UDP-GalNAc:undecaprenyl-phosphate GalNAc-1-phosphate transferase